ncbi:hypothetical protein LOAG_04283 [Loa loa]|uniref:Uncharacterized protein n=1 Tax=Loa loa TaxID=7209 RepID=A0A1S0U2Q7_LOALO|nr:hypothetical protein LOAG_04283 [Loa loa]EFO24201.1 hypothetical protein LOAG_04283 [Loa loa]
MLAIRKLNQSEKQYHNQRSLMRFHHADKYDIVVPWYHQSSLTDTFSISKVKLPLPSSRPQFNGLHEITVSDPLTLSTLPPLPSSSYHHQCQYFYHYHRHRGHHHCIAQHHDHDNNNKNKNNKNNNNNDNNNNNGNINNNNNNNNNNSNSKNNNTYLLFFRREEVDNEMASKYQSTNLSLCNVNKYLQACITSILLFLF